MTIMQQLGGSAFLAMTGAHQLTLGDDRLQFRIPQARSGINCVVIILDPADTYTMQYWRIRGTRVELVHEDRDVYCDMLQDVFTQRTGLYTHL
jgi:hypothetical protein